MKPFQIIFLIVFLIIANRNTEELALVTIYKQVFYKTELKNHPSKNNKEEKIKDLKTVNT